MIHLRAIFFCPLIFSFVVCNHSIAAEDGFYVNLNGNISIGPNSVTVDKAVFGNNFQYANGNGTNVFGYASDGRIKYDASIGWIKNNFAVEVKYFDLGSQKQVSLNGQSILSNNVGTFSGKYYGIDGKYFIPLHDGAEDLFLNLGGGKLTNTLVAPFSSATLPISSLYGSQTQVALLTGAGIRFNVSKILGINFEVNRITPIGHSLMNSGMYNTAYTVISTGLVISY